MGYDIYINTKGLRKIGAYHNIVIIIIIMIVVTSVA